MFASVSNCWNVTWADSPLLTLNASQQENIGPKEETGSGRTFRTVFGPDDPAAEDAAVVGIRLRRPEGSAWPLQHKLSITWRCYGDMGSDITVLHDQNTFDFQKLMHHIPAKTLQGKSTNHSSPLLPERAPSS